MIKHSEFSLQSHPHLIHISALNPQYYRSLQKDHESHAAKLVKENLHSTLHILTSQIHQQFDDLQPSTQFRFS